MLQALPAALLPQESLSADALPGEPGGATADTGAFGLDFSSWIEAAFRPAGGKPLPPGGIDRPLGTRLPGPVDAAAWPRPGPLALHAALAGNHQHPFQVGQHAMPPLAVLGSDERGPAASERGLAPPDPGVSPIIPAGAGDRGAAPLAALPLAAGPEHGVRQQAFGQALGEQVLWLVRGGSSQAEIRVQPEALGPVEARVSLDGERVNLQLAAAHALTREALEQALPRLREMLQEAGLQMGDTQVSDQSSRDPQGRGTAVPGRRDPAVEAIEDEARADAGRRSRSAERRLLDVYA